jgi:hypothetical protein
LQAKVEDRLTAKQALPPPYPPRTRNAKVYLSGPPLQAMQHPWFSSDAPLSPNQLLTNDREPVKQKLSEFNAQRMLGKVVKSAHRRLSAPSAGSSSAEG